MEYGDDLIAHLSEIEQKERKIRFIVKTIARYLNIDIHKAYSNRQILKKISIYQRRPKNFTVAEWKRLKGSIE